MSQYFPKPFRNFEVNIDVNAKLSSLNKIITSNKAKNLLVKNELKKLETF